MDPCAGEAEAIKALAGENQIYACEMEATRYAKAKEALGWPSEKNLVHGDAFRVSFSKGGKDGISVLFLNPPYDTDPIHGRLEQRFLERFTPVLMDGGYLIFLVPFYALKASANLLAQEYDSLTCFRFPEEDFKIFKQVLLIARKGATLFEPDPQLVGQVMAWSADASSILELPVSETRQFKVPSSKSYHEGLEEWRLRPIDMKTLLGKLRPWYQSTRGGALVPVPGVIPDLPVQELLLRTYPVATPPRPAHIAAGIASGLFNGARIEPTDPASTLPPLLVKGVFDREYRTVEEKRNKAGEVKSVVQVQQPKLVTTVLDLDTHKYHTLRTGSDESRKVEVSSMGVADLLKHYGQSLMEVMERQCPIMYDPRRDAPKVELASSSRKMFTAQAHATKAIVQLLGGVDCSKAGRKGKAAILLGEIGSGKCLGLGTLVMKYDGRAIPVEKVQTGDLLMGPDSLPRKVLGTTRGVGPLFRIIPTKGDPWECNDAHILTLVHTMSDDIFDIPLQEYISTRRLRRKLSKGGRLTHPKEEFKQFTPEAGINFSPTFPPKLDPYFLGLWYGDGTKEVTNCGLAGVSVTTGDSEIVSYLESFAESYGLWLNIDCEREGCATYRITTGCTGGKPNPVLDLLREAYRDGIYLPPEVLYGSREVREAFLAGFFDSDGSLSNGVYDFIQKRRPWSDGVCFVARSLGFRAVMTPEYKSSRRGEKGDLYWRVCLSGDFSTLPLLLPRKKATPRATQRRNRKLDVESGYRRMPHVTRNGIKVEPLGEGYYAGFELDGDGRFLLGDFTVTHNTSCALVTAKTIKSTRPLVMCPPHLLESWTNEIKVVAPEAEVRILQTVGDLDSLSKDKSDRMVISVLSRETAKLGHAWVGAGPVCPKCGSETPSVDMAKKRSRCEEKTLLASNLFARQCMGYARTISKYNPKSSAVAQLLRSRHERLRVAHYTSLHSSEGETKFHGFQKGTLDYVIEAALLDTEHVEAAQQAIVMALALAGTDDQIERVARKYLDAETYSSHDSFGRNILFLLEPGSERQTQLVEQYADKTNLSYWNPWTAFKEKVKKAVDGDEAEATVANLPVKWMGGELTVGEQGRNSIGLATRLIHPMTKLARFRFTKECGEILFQAVPEPRRVALAQHIAKRHPKLFDLIVLDEGHEYSSDNSAQGVSAHRLTALGIPTILQTGTIMNGYAESLFANMWALSPKFREEFSRDDKQRFIDRYGYRKRVLEERDKQTGEVVEFGSMSDRVTRSERVVGNAPGLLPLFLLRHLLTISVTLHKTDLAIDLPPCRQEVCHVQPSADQAKNYTRLQQDLIAAIKKDRFDEEKAGKLFGQLAELPSYLDRATSDTGNTDGGVFEIRYPESVGGGLVSAATPLSKSELLPKEQWLIDKITSELAEGRNVMVFSWHVNLLARYSRIISERLGETVPILYADKVATGKRQSWIEKEVVKKKRRILVTNPVCIQTGLNNLVHFATEIWMENPGVNPVIFRQAIGRVDRIGQKKETRIFSPVYANTLQVQMYDLLLKKVAVSVSTDGLDPSSALQAAGVGEEDYLAGLSIGKQLWAMLTDGGNGSLSA
jgi:hypothetical protein